MKELLLVVYYSVIAIAGEPPKIRSDYRSTIRANVTERVQMTCPVYRDPGLFVDWNKDNESIPPSSLRFEKKGSHLVIKDVETYDSGSYVCIATNGFGSQRIAIQLVVLDPLLTESTQSSDDLLIEALSFTEETLRQPRQVRIAAGSSLDIDCSASGYPHPDLIWLKDGAVYQRSSTRPRLTLSIRRADSGSSGNYTCLALGLKGKIETTFTIQFLGSHQLPDMSEIHPATNVTETRGNRAKFHCWVRSASSRPEVEWLKMLPVIPESGLDANTWLVVGEDQYTRLESDELVAKEEGSYLKTLQLDPLRERHAGLYLCLGTNRYGYNIETTYLYVKPNYETSKDSKSVPLSTMVALPSVLILCVAAGFACWLRERAKQRRQSELAAAAATGWNSSSNRHHDVVGQEASTGRHNRQALTSAAGCHHHLNEDEAADKRTAGDATTDRRASNYYFERHRHTSTTH